MCITSEWPVNQDLTKNSRLASLVSRRLDGPQDRYEVFPDNFYANDGRKPTTKPPVAIASRSFTRLGSRWVVPVVPLVSLVRVSFFLIQLPCDGLESSGPRIPIAFSQGDSRLPSGRVDSLRNLVFQFSQGQVSAELQFGIARNQNSHCAHRWSARSQCAEI